MAVPVVVTGATCMCPFGVAPAAIMSTNNQTVLVGGVPACVITDAAPMANITGFGMCTTLSNPAVASATAAALGVLTPQPCMPAIAGVWTGGTTLIGGKPCLTQTSNCMCAYGGTITIVNPGQMTVVAE